MIIGANDKELSFRDLAIAKQDSISVWLNFGEGMYPIYFFELLISLVYG